MTPDGEIGIPRTDGNMLFGPRAVVANADIAILRSRLPRQIYAAAADVVRFVSGCIRYVAEVRIVGGHSLDDFLYLEDRIGRVLSVAHVPVAGAGTDELV